MSQTVQQQEVSLQEKVAEILKQVKPLSLDQYEDRVKEAKKRIRVIVGEKPDRKQFQRDRKTLFSGVEWLMFILLIVLFVFSVLHVFYWTRQEAYKSYSQVVQDLSNSAEEGSEVSAEGTGITMDRNLYIVLHQVSVLGVTEIGMVALSIYHIYRRRFIVPPAHRKSTRWYVNFVTGTVSFLQTYFYLILAAACGVVILMANLSSGFNQLVSALVPLLTISLSELFARLFAERYNETQEQQRKYDAAMDEYERFTSDPTEHPEYQRVLSSYIQDWYRRNQAYKTIAWNPALLNWLSAREKYAHSIHVSDANIFERMVQEGQILPLSQGETSNSSSQTPQLTSSQMPSEVSVAGAAD